MKRAIGWLRVRDRERELQVESKLAACLILKEMAQNSPAVFNVHVKGFIDVIWNSLRHPSREIREAAVQALSVSLISKSEDGGICHHKILCFSPSSCEIQAMEAMSRESESETVCI